MKKTLLSIAAVLAAFSLGAETVNFKWIDKAPTYPIGQSFGVPFAKGEMNDNGTFVLTDASGNVIPTQSWPMAHFNDGSVKWMGFYATISPENASGLTLSSVKGPAKVKKASKKAPAPSTIVTSDTPEGIVVDNGLYQISFAKSGSDIIRSISIDGKPVATEGKLVARTEDHSKLAEDVISYRNFESSISSVEVERSGEVAAVIKAEGFHKALDGSREWLPFTVRFYIHKGAVPVKMIHTFVFDGEQSEDFIKGLGVEFTIPFREQLHNRHVAFAGEGEGLWNEAVEPFISQRRASIPGKKNNYHAEQFEGKRIPQYEEFPESSRSLIDNWAKYDDYRLVQSTSDGFTIQKRTGDHSTWFGTAGGNRARGYVLAGDVSGGLGVSLKNFWQSFPAELDAYGMRGESGKLTVWMWSPSCEAMDLRHYDIEGHDLYASYEDFVEGYATPYGIGRTSELMLFPYSELPSRDEISEQANIGQDIVQIMTSPESLHKAGAFGIWSLPDANGNDTQKYLEKQIDTYLKFYEKAVDSQRWYGFWNYGDVMHSYDNDRHVWNYDAGGKAWDNTELETDLWLWFGFIRSGRPDFYRMATAMTRHTSEVDAYHIGPMKGLGTRHNVSHWGCGAKEVRVGQAWWKRYYYYLTTDDRLGDLMHDSILADEALIDYDPLVRAQPRSEFPTSKPTRLRWGPDWTSLVGNWFTEWERTGDKKWLDKINAGMNSLTNLPNSLFTGKGPYGYDPATGVLTYEGDPEWITNSNHLANIQSSVEVLTEVIPEVGNKAFNKTYFDYASWYAVPQDDPRHSLPENAPYKNWYGKWNIQRLTAMAALERNDDYLIKLAWRRFLQGSVDRNGNPVDKVSLTPTGGSMVLVPGYEDFRVSTNGVAQWNLEAIILMGMIGDYIPDMKDIERPQRPQSYR